ncbi:MAG: hypothetical protein ABI741_07190 [Ferruginibacter sp.]
MKKMVFIATGCMFLFACNDAKKNDTTTATTTDSPAVTVKTEVPQSEFADAKYTEIGKNSLAKLSSGDVAGWMNDYADTAVYLWNNGDSLAGKKAISDYWTKRRSEVIDSLKFTQDIWLPVKVNRPQQKEQAGVWLLGWYMTDAKYKTGKRMVQWMHILMHFNSADKIDRAVHFMDRAPINAATAK